MPVIYLAGTESNGVYPGVSVTTPVQLLTQIKNALVAAGQTVTDEISSNNKIIARGIDQGDFCDKIYETVLISGVDYNLRVTGDNTVNGGTVLPTPLTITFSANGNAKLYLAADEAAECISIFNPGGTTKGIHAGWLQNRRAEDDGAWMIGYLDVWMTNAFFAKGIHGANWKEVKSFYYSAAESFTAPKAPYQLLWDNIGALAGAAGTSFANTTFNYKPWQGQNDSITGKALLLPYGYLQGASVHNGYPTTGNANLGQGLHFPGWVRFARTGLAFLDAGDQIKDGTATYVSAGTSGAEAYQGFKIAD